MSVTLFGLLWLAVAFFVFVIGKPEGVVQFLFISMVLQCNNVVYISGSGIGPQVLASLLFIVWSFSFSSAYNRMSFDPRCVSAILIFISVLVSTFINGVLSSTLIKIIQLFVYIFCFIRCFSLYSCMDEDGLKNCFLRTITFVALIGFVQFFITAGVIPRLPVIKLLFYNDPSPDVYYNINYGLRLYSTFMEPSYCSTFLVGSYFFLLSFGANRSSRQSFLMGLVLIELLATKSTTGYLSFIMLGFIQILLFRDKDTLKNLLPVIIIMIAAVILFPDLFDSVLFSKASSGSATTRTVWNNHALARWQQSPLFGCGYKESRASSLIYSLLAEEGCIGFALFLIFIVSLIFKREDESPVALSTVRPLVLAVVICQLIACPDLDLCTLWLALYMYAGTLRCSAQKALFSPIEHHPQS